MCLWFSGLFTTEEGVQDFLNWLQDESGYNREEKKTILQRITEWLDDIIDAIRDIMNSGELNGAGKLFAQQQSEALSNIRKQFLEALDGYGENYREGGAVEGKVKNEIKVDIDGNKFVEVDEKLFDAKSGESHAQTIARIIKDRFNNLISVNGQQIQINATTNREWRRSESASHLSKTAPDLYEDKLKSIPHADEIIKAAKNWIGEKLSHPRSDDIIEFARGTVYYRVNLNGYIADVLVGIKRNGSAVLYDLKNIYQKNITDASLAMASANSQRSEDTSVSNSISDSSENVKNQNKVYLDAVEKGDMDTAQMLVDEAAKAKGYTRRMFHETDADNIHIFDVSLGIHAATDSETPYGIFTKSSAKNIGLGSRQMALYVKADNTLYVEDRDDVKNKIPEMIPYFDELSRIDKEYTALAEETEEAEFDALMEWMDQNPDADMDVVYPNQYIIENRPADIDSQEYLDAFNEHLRIMEKWNTEYNKVAVKSKEMITSYLRSNGYDSMYLKVDAGSRGRQTDSLILLDSNQVKTADPITYDENGDVIPLSERFNDKDSDIRYSKKVNISNKRLTNGKGKGYNKNSTYDEFRTYGMQWAYNSETKIGDIGYVFNPRKGKHCILEATKTGEGFIVIKELTSAQWREEYESIRENEGSLREYISEFTSERGSSNNIGISRDKGAEGGIVRLSEAEGFQSDEAGNLERDGQDNQEIQNGEIKRSLNIDDNLKDLHRSTIDKVTELGKVTAQMQAHILRIGSNLTKRELSALKIQEIARKLKVDYASKLDIHDLSGRLTELYTLINEGGASYDVLRAHLDDIKERLLKESKYMKPDISDHRKALLEREGYTLSH